ncbi:MAG: muconate/chloromuconate family cycloisomerase [Candidatus Dormibacteraceae bacterium]
MKRREAGRARIARVEVHVLDLPLTFKRALSKGALPHGGEDRWRGNPVLVRIEDSEGRAGYGRLRPVNPIYGETTESIAAVIHRYYAPLLLGGDPLAIGVHVERLDALVPHNPNALAIVDMALHDLAGITLGIPVHALLGGAPARIPLDWSVSLGPIEAMVAEARRAVEEFGVRTLSLKVGPAARWAEDAEKIRSIRTAVGVGVGIGVDANETYDAATATRMIRSVAEAGVEYFEQPLDRHDLEELARLRTAIGIPILLDESVYSLADAYRAVRAHAGDCVVLKLAKSGGIVRCRQMGAVLSAAAVGHTIGGNAQGNLLEAAAYAHLWSALPGAAFAAEFILGLGVVDPDPLGHPTDGLTVEAGFAQVPVGPGLGVSIDPEAVRERSIAHHEIA